MVKKLLPGTKRNKVISTWNKYKEIFSDFIWSYRTDSAPALIAFIIKTCRTLLTTLNDLSKGQVTLHASSLVYTTLLSLIPLFAVSFSILKGIGLHNHIEPVLSKLLSPLGEQSTELTTRIIDMVENIQVGVLGLLGVFFLVYTSISLLNKIEHIFNQIWHVKPTQSWPQKISRYISVLAVGPPLIVLALAGMATLSNSELIKSVLAALGLSAWATFVTSLLPYLFIISAFTFIYMFIPNTHVRLKAAVTGAIFAGILWETIGWVFSAMIATSTNYAAIYSGLAVLILFIIWLYLSWTIMLLGASFTFYTQYPAHSRHGLQSDELSNFSREQIALSLLNIIVQNFKMGTTAPTISDLSRLLNQTPDFINTMLAPLENENYISRTDQHPATFLPGKSPDTVLLTDVLGVIRGSDNKHRNLSVNMEIPEVEEILNETEDAINKNIAGKTLSDLVNKDLPGPD